MAKNICSNKKWVLLVEYAGRHHALHQDVPHLPTRQSRESQSLGTLGTSTCANKTLGKCISRLHNTPPKSRGICRHLGYRRQFSKYATFVPTPKLCSAELTAQLFFKHVVKLWGIPSSIISDRDGRFIGTFWTELFAFLGTTLNISSSYHPQTDGQTEWFNCLLEEYLRHFVDARQKNWIQLLDVAQFCFNCQTSSYMGKSPFEIVSGRQPALPHIIDHSYVVKHPQAQNFTREWK